ncbi:hypothetical protein [Chitinophaga sp. sic0106]|uniref:hypothetical protein n=1 Tax=Chitinophaga sp. sic0106 TaxID=2854785 RepID=UPI001C456B50|nr:hypothetical protein [Chitinophaga sp. sic0106]MBV7531081.1 hypothetical protein [Chitinophaga sp. sic0106]
MITTLVGKTFLKAYNEKYNISHSAKSFFTEVYFELFFNHPKYMQWITNSPFVQMKTGQKPEKLSPEDRKAKLEELFSKVENESPDASFALGYPAAEGKEYASTSGLVSDVNTATDKEDVYYSWIGSGLGIGVAGGYNILINDPIITMETFEGWIYYRKYLNEPTLDRLRGNQINTWNGQWLTYKLGQDYREDFDFARLHAEDFFTVSSNLIEANTVNWSNLFFSLSQLYPSKTLNTYIYSFGQTNKTIGFIPMYLKAGNELKEVFKQIFKKESTSFKTKEFQALFGMHIKRACELGNIGLHALRPENLRKHMDENKNISFKKEGDIIIYQSYKTWLIAMLSKNKEEILDYTSELALLIQRYRAGAKGTDRKNIIENDLFGAKTKRVFLEGLTKMLPGIGNNETIAIKKLRDDVHLMTNEEFTYFNTLLKFDYAILEK